MNNPVALVNNLIRRGNARSQKIKINIVYSLGIKGISIATSFIMVPVTLKYLGTTDFGIWLTLSSVIAWFGFFDIGLGNGLRNKFTEAKAQGDIILARTYVSTTYAGLSIIMISLLTLFLAINSFIDWNSLLKAPAGNDYNLNTLTVFIFTLFVFRMILKLISVIILADQRTALSNIFDPLSNIISLGGIYLLTVFTAGSLSNFVLIVTIAPVLVLLAATLWFFRKDYKPFRPSLKYIDFKHFKELAGLSIRFFLIQISVLVIFSTDNLIITRITGPDDVTLYNIAYKYFNIITMGFAIIMAPMWSAFTEAYILDDTQWIRNINRKLIKLWFLILLSVIVMLFSANWFYSIWIGDKIKIPMLLNIFMGTFILISTWNNIFVYYINGTGKIKLQAYSSVLSALLNIPISIFLARNLGLGAAGVILGTCISLFPGIFLGPVQYYKLLNKTDSGIWSK
jgi:O-antigen/teichoic acid export membrane protein